MRDVDKHSKQSRENEHVPFGNQLSQPHPILAEDTLCALGHIVTRQLTQGRETGSARQSQSVYDAR
jgi:hypothetical protein